MEDKMFNDILDVIIPNASAQEIEIIRGKLNNHLINHIYDNDVQEELSNNFDSSSCLFCHCQHIIKYGKNKKDNQRYWCKDCHKTFSSITGSLLCYTKKEPYQWYLYIESLFNGDTIKKTASIARISEYTSLVWRHKILSICAQLTDDEHILSDTVYLDEKLADVRYPGIILNKADDSKIKRGISNQKKTSSVQ